MRHFNTPVLISSIDSSVSGSAWRTLASPSLAHLIRNASQVVILPQQADKSLWDSRSDIGPFKGPMDKSFEETLKSEHAKKLSVSASTGVGPLGSGSDYTVFLQRLGVGTAYCWISRYWIHISFFTGGINGRRFFKGFERCRVSLSLNL